MAATTAKDEVRLVEFKVNGIELEVKSQKLAARKILELAKESGAMPGKPDEYELQGDKGLYTAGDVVNLTEDYTFITLPTAPTPVA